MPLYSTHQISEPKQEGVVHVMNYTTKDFAMEYLDSDNKPHTVSIPALDSKPFPKQLATSVINHLANFILNLQDFSYTTDPNLELSKIKEKVTINTNE